MKIKTFLSLLLTCSFVLTSCENEENNQDELHEISGVAFNTNSLELAIGDTVTITATILPYSLNALDIEWAGEMKDKVVWGTDNPEVATVTKQGLIKAVGKGSCIIQLSCGTYAAKCNVTVRDFDIETLYGQWQTDDSTSYYFQYDGTGKVQDSALNWSFDGMRLTIESLCDTSTYVIVSTEPGRFFYYDINDPDKKREKMQMIAKRITIDDLKQGIIEIEGKNGLKYEAVDLGLPNKVLWSTCNLMAQSPEDAGYFYAWGETETKEQYYLENYKWYDDSTLVLTKYVNNDSISHINLEKEDDAANTIMDGNWRIPTSEDIISLCNNCFIIWSNLNDVDGMIFISKIKGYEGNSIFIPLSGIDQNYNNTDSDRLAFGIYWSSTLSSNDDFCAYNLQLSNMPSLDVYNSYYPNSIAKRWSGACIRPVIVQ